MCPYDPLGNYYGNLHVRSQKNISKFVFVPPFHSNGTVERLNGENHINGMVNAVLVIKMERIWFFLLLLYIVRLTEQSRLASEQKRLVADVRDKLTEYQAWNVKYNVSETCTVRLCVHKVTHSYCRMHSRRSTAQSWVHSLHTQSRNPSI